MRTMTLELPDEVYEEILRTARENQLPPAQVAAARVTAGFPVRKPQPVLTPEDRESALARLTRHFGRANSGDPNSANNERIDADLAREYAGNHENEASC
jgi:hypothetical protein